MIVVLDASGGVEVAARTDFGIDIMNTLMRAEMVLAPDLYITEITNIIWKHSRNMKKDKEKCLVIVEDCVALVHEYVKSEDLWKDALLLAQQHDHSVYDMLYASLAKRNDATLISLDKQLCRICEKISVQVKKF